MQGQITIGSLIIFVVVCSFSNAQGQGDSASSNPYFELDKYAKETPDNVSRSTKQLAEYLEKKATNDTAKARLIFTWVATHINYDDKAYNTGNIPNRRPGMY